MKKALTNNLGLKLLSLLIAFGIWLVVVNIDDPVISTSYSGVKVDIINGNSLTEKGKTYEILDGTDYINVTITGKRSVVESIGKENIYAIADIQDLSIMDTVEIKLSTNKNSDQIDSIKSTTSSLQLNIENLKEIHLPINVVVSGEPAEGYIAGDINTNQNTIRVSGPESIINEISYAEAEVNIGGRTSDITTNCDIRLYSNDNEVVESQYITTNIKNVNLSATILSTKAVDIIYSYCGVPEDGYMVSNDLNIDRQAVYIAGKQNAIDNISSIVVPETAIDITGATEDYTANINLNSYLPDGIRFADNKFDGKVKVTVPVEKTVERNYDVPLSSIVLVNIPDGFNAEVLMDTSNVISEQNSAEEEENKANVTMKISTSGILSEYDTIPESSVRGYVDIENYMNEAGVQNIVPGVYRIPIMFNLPDKIMINNNYYAVVKIDAEKQ